VASQAILQDASGPGENEIRSRGAEHEQINVVCRDAGFVKRSASGLLRKIARRLTIRRDVSRRNAGSLFDPLIARINDLFKFGVGQDAFRQIAADAR